MDYKDVNLARPSLMVAPFDNVLSAAAFHNSKAQSGAPTAMQTNSVSILASSTVGGLDVVNAPSLPHL